MKECHPLQRIEGTQLIHKSIRGPQLSCVFSIYARAPVLPQDEKMMFDCLVQPDDTY